jgi:hypothetical protein
MVAVTREMYDARVMLWIGISSEYRKVFAIEASAGERDKGSAGDHGSSGYLYRSCVKAWRQRCCGEAGVQCETVAGTDTITIY